MASKSIVYMPSQQKRAMTNPIPSGSSQFAEAAVNYRTDIEGLRAPAILMLCVFYAFPNLLRDGFIGVDVFFVISGYLITRIDFCFDVFRKILSISCHTATLIRSNGC